MNDLQSLCINEDQVDLKGRFFIGTLFTYIFMDSDRFLRLTARLRVLFVVFRYVKLSDVAKQTFF